jgi:hypothetical protein
MGGGSERTRTCNKMLMERDRSPFYRPTALVRAKNRLWLRLHRSLFSQRDPIIRVAPRASDSACRLVPAR